MIQVPRNIKDGDILIYRGGKLEAVDPAKLFNYDSQINDLRNEIKIKNQLLNDIVNDHLNFKEKIEEYDKIKLFEEKIDKLTEIVTKYITGVAGR